eukprot:2855290-Rhodomonas_salina.5
MGRDRGHLSKSNPASNSCHNCGIARPFAHFCVCRCYLDRQGQTELPKIASHKCDRSRTGCRAVGPNEDTH